MSRPVLLIVDDERLVLKALARSLRRLPCDIVQADGARAALLACEQTPPDIVISDMRMPDMDGATLLTEIRQRYPDTIRIIISGFSDSDSTRRAVDEGQIDHFVAKPWDDVELRRLLEAKIHEVQARRR